MKNSEKSRHKKGILTVMQGILLLIVLSTLLSTAISLFMTSLVEELVNVEMSETDFSLDQEELDALAKEETGNAASEIQEEEPASVKEVLKATSGSLKPTAVIMWLGLSLLFLMMAITLRQEWKYNLLRYGIGSILFACCAVIFLASDEKDSVYMLIAILHMAGLTADHIFSIVKNHRGRNAALRILCILLLGAGLAFDGKIALIYLLVMTCPRIFYYIARIAFSQVKMEILQKIIRKTYATEILFGLLLLITAFSIVLPKFEMNMPTFGDALWYCFAIVTTIGFGDLAAVTIPGRIISVILGLYGLIVVALITSIIVNLYNETKE